MQRIVDELHPASWIQQQASPHLWAGGEEVTAPTGWRSADRYRLAGNDRQPAVPRQQSGGSRR